MFRIVLPVDNDEERSLAAAEAISTLPGDSDEVTVTLLNIHEPVEVRSSEGGEISSEDWYDEEDFPKSVRNVGEYLEELGVTIETRREHADPAETIVNVARDLDANRIIMGGRKRSPVGKAVFGSVIQKVLLNAEVPVTVVPEAES